MKVNSGQDFKEEKDQYEGHLAAKGGNVGLRFRQEKAIRDFSNSNFNRVKGLEDKLQGIQDGVRGAELQATVVNGMLNEFGHERKEEDGVITEGSGGIYF